jgi:hypothetical protein
MWLALAQIAVVLAQLALGFSSFMLFGMAPSDHPLSASGLLTPLMLFIVVATFVPLVASIVPIRMSWRWRFGISLCALVLLAAVSGGTYLMIATP